MGFQPQKGGPPKRGVAIKGTAIEKKKKKKGGNNGLGSQAGGKEKDLRPSKQVKGAGIGRKRRGEAGGKEI